MVKIIAAVLILAAVISGGVYYALQPKTLPTPTYEKDPSGVSQSTVNDVRIIDPRWLSEDRNLLWVVCRLGESRRVRTNLLINLADKSTKALLRGANLVSWISDHEILVYNQGKTDSKWDNFIRLINPDNPSYIVSRFYILDVNSGNMTQICELKSTRNPTFIDSSPNGKRIVISSGPKETFEFETTPGFVPKAFEASYLWAPTWIDNDTYFFVGEESLVSRKFGEDGTKPVSAPLLGEIREAIANYGSPTLKICGQIGEHLLMVNHDPQLDYDGLLVLGEPGSMVEEMDLLTSVAMVSRLISSSELPRFNDEGTMMVYQGQQFDKNMDTVYLQEIEVDSKPIELITGEFGGTHESTPLFWNEESVLYVHRGIEVRSISLADGNIELHWPIAVVP